MTSGNSTSMETALRRLLHDRIDKKPVRGLRGGRVLRRSAARKAPTRPSSSVVARELDWFRRGQSLPYWEHDRRSD
jgi:hypothetical protein